MTTITRRQLVQTGATGVAGALAAPSTIAHAQTKRWRMVTSWPKALARSRHVGGARRRAHQIAVRGTARHCGARRRRGGAGVRGAGRGRRRRRRNRHTLRSTGKQDAGCGVLHHRAVSGSPPASTSPGSRPAAARRCGTALRAVRREALHGGQHRVCMGGWFRNEIKSKADLGGTKIRSLGLGGEVYRRLGATPQTTPRQRS